MRIFGCQRVGCHWNAEIDFCKDKMGRVKMESHEPIALGAEYLFKSGACRKVRPEKSGFLMGGKVFFEGVDWYVEVRRTLHEDEC